MQDLETLRSELMGAVSGAADLDALERLRVGELGKKGLQIGGCADGAHQFRTQRFEVLHGFRAELLQRREPFTRPGPRHQGDFRGWTTYPALARASWAWWTRASKASGSRTARSASTLRSISTPALVSPLMNCE